MADEVKPVAAPTTAPATRPVWISDPKQTHIQTQWKYGSPIISCRIDPTGRFVFAGAEDRSIQRWEIASGKQAGFVAHESWVKAIAFSKDGGTLISGGYDGRLIWWEAAGETAKPIRTIQAHEGWVRQVAVSPDGKLIASCGNDRVVRLWNLADGARVWQSPGQDSHVYSTQFHPSGQTIVGGTLHGKVEEYEVGSGKVVRSFDAKTLFSYNQGQGVDFGGVRDMSFSPDGTKLACGGLYKAENPLGAVHEPLVLVFERESGKLMASLTSAIKGVAWRTVWHRDGYVMVASGGTGGGFLIFWEADKPAEFHKFALPNTALDMDVHPDGLRVATAHFDQGVRMSRMGAKV